jgi:hypothetical protein
MSRARILSLLVAVIALTTGCGGGDRPEVSVLGVSPDALDASDDASNDLTIRVHYDDPNAELGGGVAKVIDCRAEGLVSELRLPSIASPAAVKAGVPIEGELDLLVADVLAEPAAHTPAAACADLGVGAPEASGAQAFCVVLVDAKGVASEGACTKAILVRGP